MAFHGCEVPTHWEGRLRALAGHTATHLPKVALQGARLRHNRDEYIRRIHDCQKKIREGESYECCLTNMLFAEPISDPLQYYCGLRRTNPTPYSAFARFGELAIACYSPERFLRVEPDGTITSKPIKGTARRIQGNPSADVEQRDRLLADQKTAAEHLMIVDLVRNDIGRVSQPGSVSVPSFRVVESYSTVHQLVSSVQGRLRPDCDAVDAVMAAFPPGSMTGAPKHRTLEILDRLEEAPRGVYSGAFGYFGLDGCTDLNVVIRTAICTPAGTTIGSGGAIVASSDPDQEWEEMLLKLEALL
jgi:para-aminobenzoate synthetase